MDFKQKYLKYKQKYLELKTKLKFKEQLGGAFPFSTKAGGSIAIMAKITGDTLDRVNERRTKLGLAPQANLHITLLQLHINFENPDSEIFLDKGFIHEIRRAFITHVKGPGVELESPQGSWDFLGIKPTLEDKFFVRLYTLPQIFINNIKQFRLQIYKFLTARVHVDSVNPLNQIRGIPPDTSNFVIYSTPRAELYAITRDYYYGVDTWRPHISLLKINELPVPFIQQIKAQPTVRQQADSIIHTIGKVKPINSIKMNINVTELYISIRTPPAQARLNARQKEFHVPV